MTSPVIAFEPAPVAARNERRALIAAQAEKLWALQRPDGHVVFKLEADCTIPAEYVLLRHFLGEIDSGHEARIAKYLRGEQNRDGSWPLCHDGPGNISATIKGCWALKLTGEDIETPHMARARSWVLGQGGCRQRQRLHPFHHGAVWPDPLARRAGDAGGMRVAAGVVSVPHIEDRLLVAHGADPIADPLCKAGQGQESNRTRHRRIVHRAAGGATALPDQPQRQRHRPGVPGARPGVAGGGAPAAQPTAPTCDQTGGRVPAEPSQRRRRAGGNLSGDGQRGDGAEDAGLCGSHPPHEDSEAGR